MLFLLFSFALSPTAFAEIHEKFLGEAREKGTLVYTEHHDVTKDDAGKPLEATTTYVGADGKTLGVLRSDFRHSLNLPEHEFDDRRTGVHYGIRRTPQGPEMFSRRPGEPEQVKRLENDEDGGRIQVGCQGFNYYLYGRVDQIKEKKILPVRFLIPGDLTSYKFELEYQRDNPDQTTDFSVKIENWFLRLFAPKLEFRYDRKINRIAWYRGLSNLKNEKGKMMQVEIDYKY